MVGKTCNQNKLNDIKYFICDFVSLHSIFIIFGLESFLSSRFCVGVSVALVDYLIAAIQSTQYPKFVKMRCRRATNLIDDSMLKS